MARHPGWIGLFVIAAVGSGCTRDATPRGTTASAAPHVATAAPVATDPITTKAPEPLTPKALTISPAKAVIAPGDTGVQFLATARGGGRDVTTAAVWSVEPSGLLALDAGGYVRPLAAGTATLKATFDGDTVSVPVEVVGAEARAWNFAEDVVPILTRAGCNSGGCHGKGDGQNGFHLSLFGYDPEGDHAAITRDRGGPSRVAVRPVGEPVLREGDRSYSPRGRAARRTRLGRGVDASRLAPRRCSVDARHDSRPTHRLEGGTVRSPARRTGAAATPRRRPLRRRPRARRHPRGQLSRQ